MSAPPIDTIDVGPRGIAFLDAVSSVCRAHGIQIVVGGYDELQLHELTNTEPAIYANGVVDYLE